MKFDQLIEKYYKFLISEQEENNKNDEKNLNNADQNLKSNEKELKNDEEKKDIASPSFTFLVNIIFEALKIKEIPNKNDIKYSINKVRNKNEAFKYLEIIINNFPEQIKNKFKKGYEIKFNNNDLDEVKFIDMVNLALKALFYIPKDNNTEYNEIVLIDEITPENAKKVYNMISRFLIF